MSKSRRAIFLVIVAVFLAPLHCRRAGGVERDPVEREAEEKLVNYLRIDTSNPPGNESAGARFLQQLLIKEGIEGRLVGDDPARQSVYARLASGSNEEELGGLHGCKELLEKHPELFANVGYVLNEGGTNETIVDKVTFWGIEVQEKVPLWLRLTFKGPPGHSAVPPDGGGSVGSMIRALDAIQKIEMPYRLPPAVKRAFRALGAPQ